MTPQQKRAYISRPNHCPFCDSIAIEAGPVDYDSPMSQDVTCQTCGKTWRDTLAVVDVRELK